MALIKTLKDFLTKTVIYPTTKTNAVYDDKVGRLDTYLHNTLGAEPIDDVEEETAELRDADILGGRYTAEDLDAMPKSSAIEDYANVEPPMVDADALGGKKASEYALKTDILPKYEGNFPSTEVVAVVTKNGTGKYTIQKDGWVQFNMRCGGSGTNVVCRINNIVVTGLHHVSCDTYSSFYCRKGDVLSISIVGDGTTTWGRAYIQ